MRFLSFLFNPVAHLFWWIVKTIFGGIDRRLNTQFGWLLAWVFVLLSAASLLGAAYSVREPAMKLIGLMERPAPKIVDGLVIAVDTLERKTLTIRQNIVAQYEVNGSVSQVEDTVTEPVSKERNVGDAIPIYVSQAGVADLDNPEDPFLDAFLTALALFVPALLLYYSYRYLQYRARVNQEWESGQGRAADGFEPAVNAVVMRGRQAVKTHAQRLKDEQDIIQAMYDKGNRDKQNRR